MAEHLVTGKDQIDSLRTNVLLTILVIRHGLDSKSKRKRNESEKSVASLRFIGSKLSTAQQDKKKIYTKKLFE